MLEKIIELIAEETDGDVSEINENTNLYDDLDMDSMDILSMALSFEEEFGVRFEKSEISLIKTVSDIQALIIKKQEN
jgi:acyl carrier protein